VILSKIANSKKLWPLLLLKLRMSMSMSMSIHFKICLEVTHLSTFQTCRSIVNILISNKGKVYNKLEQITILNYLMSLLPTNPSLNLLSSQLPISLSITFNRKPVLKPKIRARLPNSPK